MVRVFILSVFCVCAVSLNSVLAQNELIRDPTQPINYVPSDTGYSSANANGYKLSAVFESSRPSALINGKRYHVGETIDGYTVKSIRPSKVVLQKDEEQMELSLYSSKVIVR